MSLRICFVDDEKQVLKIFERWKNQLSNGLHARFTTVPQQALNWIEKNLIDVLVVDLRMAGVNGVDLLEQAHEIDIKLKLLLMTGFHPNDGERLRCEKIGAKFFFKTSVDKLLNLISPNNKEVVRQTAIELRTHSYELLLKEFAEDYLVDLKKIANPETEVVNSHPRFTVSDLIADVDKLTPRGIEHIRQWRRVKSTLVKLGKK